MIQLSGDAEDKVQALLNHRHDDLDDDLGSDYLTACRDWFAALSETERWASEWVLILYRMAFEELSEPDAARLRGIAQLPPAPRFPLRHDGEESHPAIGGALGALEVFDLQRGLHRSAEEEVCAMEAVAWLAGEPHSATPLCTSPVIASLVIALNDCMSKSARQRLLAFLPRLVGSSARAHESARNRHLISQAIRAFAPVGLFSVNERALAEFLRDLPETATLSDLLGAAHHARAEAYRTTAAYKICDGAWNAAYWAEKFGSGDECAIGSAVAVLSMASDAAGRISDTAQHRVWEAGMATLDDLLALGPSGSPQLSSQLAERIDAFGRLSLSAAWRRGHSSRSD